jgi:hypothetical protein
MCDNKRTRSMCASYKRTHSLYATYKATHSAAYNRKQSMRGTSQTLQPTRSTQQDTPTNTQYAARHYKEHTKNTVPNKAERAARTMGGIKCANAPPPGASSRMRWRRRRTRRSWSCTDVTSLDRKNFLKKFSKKKDTYGTAYVRTDVTSVFRSQNF